MAATPEDDGLMKRSCVANQALNIRKINLPKSALINLTIWKRNPKTAILRILRASSASEKLELTLVTALTTTKNG